MTDQRPDPLVRVVERVIEEHLPGGTEGVDIGGLAHAVVRRVRQEQDLERLAGQDDKLAALLDERVADDKGRVDAYTHRAADDEGRA
ncbi:hypothetical protein OKJ48_29930 [Streptomyces kunmingensis]|uniref:Uncharacterized protein n=1 Tax=Streptomyces kunmingensis TaxID=68225 RepID=A0ABU6CI63_9ACTN|nr:hypothetical protein [Streptomyces kunmingensis]MEB3964421.1 hypothetical protein [Streptomyces kunmingensis]